MCQVSLSLFTLFFFFLILELGKGPLLTSDIVTHHSLPQLSVLGCGHDMSWNEGEEPR